MWRIIISRWPSARGQNGLADNKRIRLYKHPTFHSHARETANPRKCLTQRWFRISWIILTKMFSQTVVTGHWGRMETWRNSPSMENVWKDAESTPSGVRSDTRYRMNTWCRDNPQQSFSASTKQTDEAEGRTPWGKACSDLTSNFYSFKLLRCFA